MGAIAPVRSHIRLVRLLLRVHHERFLLKYVACALSGVNTLIKGYFFPLMPTQKKGRG